MDSNAIGCIAEYKFGIECLKRDIKVSYPLIHTSVYDCLADTGNNIYRIQIKSTTQGFQKNSADIVYRGNARIGSQLHGCLVCCLNCMPTCWNA